MTLAIAKEKRQILLSFNRWKDCSLASFDYDLLKCIFRKNRALAPHEQSAVPLGTDHCPVGYTAIFFPEPPPLRQADHPLLFPENNE